MYVLPVFLPNIFMCAWFFIILCMCTWCDCVCAHHSCCILGLFTLLVYSAQICCITVMKVGYSSVKWSRVWHLIMFHTTIVKSGSVMGNVGRGISRELNIPLAVDWVLSPYQRRVVMGTRYQILYMYPKSEAALVWKWNSHRRKKHLLWILNIYVYTIITGTQYHVLWHIVAPLP